MLGKIEGRGYGSSRTAGCSLRRVHKYIPGRYKAQQNRSLNDCRYKSPVSLGDYFARITFMLS